MSVALRSDHEVETDKDAYDAEFEGDAVAPERDEDEPLGPPSLCVDRETSCILTFD